MVDKYSVTLFLYHYFYIPSWRLLETGSSAVWIFVRTSVLSLSTLYVVFL